MKRKRSHTIKDLLKNFDIVFGLNTLIIAVLAVVATYYSKKFELFINFPLTIIGIAVVFPIVFSIGSAYKRREVALTHYATIKSQGRAIYFASRDWVKNSKKEQSEMKKLLKEILDNTKSMLKNKNNARIEKIVYSDFSKISKLLETLREKGMTAGEVSRSNQFLSKMIHAFENLKHIAQYRTPITLRTYSRGFTYILPIIYGPYFAHISKDVGLNLLSYIMPFLFAFVLVSLANIQNHLEDPFDQIGEDDIKINTSKFLENLD